MARSRGAVAAALLIFGCSSTVEHQRAGGDSESGIGGASGVASAGAPSSASSSGGERDDVGSSGAGGDCRSEADGGMPNWLACASFDDWLASGMDKLASAHTVGEGTCGGCHSNGAGGVLLSSDAEKTFEFLTTYPYSTRLVTGVSNDCGSFVGCIPSTALVAAGSKPCETEPCHPIYALEPSILNGLKTFVDATNARFKAGRCDP